MKLYEAKNIIKKTFGQTFKKYFLHFNLKIREHNKIVKVDNFIKLPLEKQQETF